jgi:hypothetical protein
VTEDEFWNIIEKSLEECGENRSARVASMVAELEALGEGDIMEFERQLRTKIIECDDYGTMAAAKIIDGSVSDDSYLYFRCWLIGRGREVFDGAVEDPDSIADVARPDEFADFEDLLYVATSAFEHKTGREEDETFPRDTCSDEGLDYDFNAPPTKGLDWEEEDLPRLYPRLWALYN